MSVAPDSRPPEKLRAGDKLDFLVEPLSFTDADGYAPVAVFVSDDGQTRIVSNGTTYGASFRITELPAVTRTWAPASGTLTVFAEKSDDRRTILTARFQILPDPAANPATVTKSHARKVLEAIEAVIENRATHDQQSISIDGHSIGLMSFTELIQVRATYQAIVQGEESAQDSTGRKAKRSIIEPRFSR